MENPNKIEIEGLKTIHKLCNFGADHNMEGCSFTEIVERMFDELAKAQAVPELCASVEAHKIIIDEVKTEINDGYDLCQDSYLLDVLVHRGIQIGKAQAVPEGFVLVPVDQLNQWGHMANYAEQYSCPECFEARGYAHTLTCEINEYFAIEAQEQSHD